MTFARPAFALALVAWLAAACGGQPMMDPLVGRWVADVDATVDAMLAMAPSSTTPEQKEARRADMRATLVGRLEVRPDKRFTWAHAMKADEVGTDEGADGDWMVVQGKYALFPDLGGRPQRLMRMDATIEGDVLRLTAAGKPFVLRRARP